MASDLSIDWGYVVGRLRIPEDSLTRIARLHCGVTMKLTPETCIPLPCYVVMIFYSWLRMTSSLRVDFHEDILGRVTPSILEQCSEWANDDEATQLRELRFIVLDGKYVSWNFSPGFYVPSRAEWVDTLPVAPLTILALDINSLISRAQSEVERRQQELAKVKG